MTSMMNDSQRLNSIYYTLLTTLLALCFLILPQNYFNHFSLLEQLQAAAIFLKGKNPNNKEPSPGYEGCFFTQQVKSILSRSTFAKGKTHFFAEVGC